MRLNGAFEIEQSDGIVILTAVAELGEFQREHAKSRFEETLERLSMQHIDNVVVDLNHADYYGSLALGFLAGLWKVAAGNGGRLVLCNVSKHGAEILRITHLNRLCYIAVSKDYALQIMQESEHACVACA